MKHWLLIIVLILPLASIRLSVSAAVQATESAVPSKTTDQTLNQSDPESRKARALIDQAIQALGGQAYLSIHDIETEGRTYSFYHGRPTSNGVLFWRFVEYPEKERIELTKDRDVAYVYHANKGYEITYKGAHEIEKKDLDDYLRRRRLSLETILRTWINDPSVALLYEGNALAGNQPAQQVTLINAKDEAVHLFFDVYTHLPIKKTYSWRDPVDRERDNEEEIYDNYHPVQGVMTPWGFTRYYNGDMQSQRFLHAIHYNQGVDETMFDPNSGYNPNKPAGKR